MAYNFSLKTEGWTEINSALNIYKPDCLGYMVLALFYTSALIGLLRLMIWSSWYVGNMICGYSYRYHSNTNLASISSLLSFISGCIGKSTIAGFGFFLFLLNNIFFYMWHHLSMKLDTSTSQNTFLHSEWLGIKQITNEN